MSRKRKTPADAVGTTHDVAPPGGTYESEDLEALDGDPAPERLAPPAPGDEGIDLEALDGDPDAPLAPDPRPDPVAGLSPPVEERAPAEPPAGTERLEDAVAGADPAEPLDSDVSPLATSGDAGPEAKKGAAKKGAAKKGDAAALLGTPTQQCERATAAISFGPLVDLMMAGIPTYLTAPGGTPWQAVLEATRRNVAEAAKRHGPQAFDVNLAAVSEGISALVAAGPTAFVHATFTVYQLDNEDGGAMIPALAMPGSLPLPDPLPEKLAGRAVVGTVVVPATPGMGIVYNLADSGLGAVEPVIDALAAFVAKHAAIVRPMVALLIGLLSGYRTWRDLTSPAAAHAAGLQPGAAPPNDGTARPGTPST